MVWITEDCFWLVRCHRGVGRRWRLWALLPSSMEILIEGELEGSTFATRRQALDALDDWIRRRRDDPAWARAYLASLAVHDCV